MPLAPRLALVWFSPVSSPDDFVTELALRAGRGDRDALTTFIEQTQADVWRFLAHLAGREQADDLTQETYLRVLKALPRFAGRSSARTWLLTLARRAWVDSVRHDMARPRTSATDYADAASRSASPDNPNTWSEVIDARMLIDALPAERREAIVLTQVMGYTYEEAARIAGVRVGTIRSRVARARRDLIEGAGGAPDRPR
ncbi:RNA polymerase sigma factor [Corynebacterium liangguodongii]|uniref:RNA polymerase subunit sigma n=1 Tax=Corynebacterium liangguodongii TaxID=2079535 RepID=A0A2S0WBR3_9CORY|nr:RNA polymerase sigma factor [Corynebacterium liangguodongii]AWB83203.1 RNA polymerase subunit sigma [Corynebacterium liangguodongii]PWB98798.1 RNA polymerase subunit sigma [Corynebacterium liangguodongii]